MTGETHENRVIFRLTGADRVSFLQGLVTNDVTREGLVYAALLTPQGKYLADFFLLETGEAMLLDVDAALAPMLKQRLSMYKLRADVAIEETELFAIRGLDEAPAGAHPDPRDASLGWRLYADAPGDAPTIDWTAIRVDGAIPETGAELTPETYILEAGFDRLNGVDFRKGCYVGQEVTARMKHKTELKKGYVAVTLAGAAQPGDEITTAEGKPAGHLTSRAGDKGLAYLRFDRAEGALHAGEARVTWTR